MAGSMRWKVLAAAAALSGALGACGGDDDKGGDDKPTGKADASTGSNNPLDIPRAQLADGVAGKQCKADSECGGTEATCLKDPNDAEAVGVCTGACDTDKECGAGGSCVKISDDFPGACGKVCTTAAQCGSDELDCIKGIDFNNLFGQVSSALTDAGISLGEDAGISANATPKTCQPKGEPLVTLGAGVAGKACAEDSACGGGSCADSLFFRTAPEGYCTTSCDEDSTCGAGAICPRTSLAVSLNLRGNCVLKCTANSECRTGYECGTSQLGGSSAGKYCIPVGRTQGASDAGVADASAADATVNTPDATTPDSGVPDAAN